VQSFFLSLGLADADENCKRFIDRCMPEAFKKVCVCLDKQACECISSTRCLLEMVINDEM